ncbi:MAG TPA: glycosyltransferase family 39 protein, partial [Anaerolineaceae bacterium]|nr:glycosyltransferase family 39 protein [Anaerolineaceae bacterium]
MKSHWKNWLILFLILTAAAGWKAWLMIAEVVPFNSDEAIVALMARHILQGERPIFFYGQAYMGSLDAWLVAAGFALFGQNIWVIRLVQTILYIGTIITTFLVLKDWFGEKAGLIGAALLAIPPVNMTLYTTASLGGYGEALLLGNIILWLGWRIRNYLVKQEIPSAKKLAALFILFGLVAGL